MLINQKNAHGGDIYSNCVVQDFSANVSLLGTAPKVKKAIKKSAKQVLQYPDPYCTSLRKNLATHHQIDPSRIICGNGAAEVIFHFVQGLKPKNAMIVAPTFCEYENALKTVDCTVIPYILTFENQFHLTEDFLKHIPTDCQVIFICNPNNPTGQLYPPQLINKIAQHCQKNKIFLFLDECFLDLTIEGQKNSMVSATVQNPYLFILKAFTKSFGMAGVRLGYGICSNDLLLEKMSSQTQVWNVSTVAQQCGIAAVQSEAFLKKLVEQVTQQRCYLQTAFIQMGFDVVPSQTNFILVRSTEDLHQKLMAQGILIRPCNNFLGLDERYFRFAVKNKKQNKFLIKKLQKRGE